MSVTQLSVVSLNILLCCTICLSVRPSTHLKQFHCVDVGFHFNFSFWWEGRGFVSGSLLLFGGIGEKFSKTFKIIFFFFWMGLFFFHS